MATDFLSAVHAVIEWAKAPVKTMLILCTMSAFALFAPAKWEDTMQIHGLVASHFGLLYAVFAFSVLYLVFTGVQNTSRLVFIPYKRFRALRSLAAIFRGLSDDEVGVLLKYVSSGRVTLHFPPDHLSGPLQSTLLELETKGIIEDEGTSAPYFTVLHGYSLTSEANTYLRNPKVRSVLKARYAEKAISG